MAKPDPFVRTIAEAFGQTFGADEYGREDYDVGEGPGDRDFDADEYVESKAPKPYDDSFRRDTPQDQVAVKRAYEDRAARQADEMMAQYQTQLAAPSAVQARLDDQKAQEDAQRRLLALQYLRGNF
jgi:hypothetical protein